MLSLIVASPLFIMRWAGSCCVRSGARLRITLALAVNAARGVQAFLPLARAGVPPDAGLLRKSVTENSVDRGYRVPLVPPPTVVGEEPGPLLPGADGVEVFASAVSLEVTDTVGGFAQPGWGESVGIGIHQPAIGKYALHEQPLGGSTGFRCEHAPLLVEQQRTREPREGPRIVEFQLRQLGRIGRQHQQHQPSHRQVHQ